MREDSNKVLRSECAGPKTPPGHEVSDLHLNLFQVAPDAVENTVDELDGLWAGELASNFNRFVDYNRPRCLRVAQELRHRGAEDISIYRRHPLHAPMLRMSFDKCIDVGRAIRRRTKQVIRKAANVLSNLISLGPECLPDVVRPLPPHVCLKQHLQSEFAGFSAGTHNAVVSLPSSVISNRALLGVR